MNIREVNHMSARHFVPHCRMQLLYSLRFKPGVAGLRRTENLLRARPPQGWKWTEADAGLSSSHKPWPGPLGQAARSSDSSQDQIHGYEPETVAVKIKDILKVLVLKVSFYWLANQR